MNDSNAHLYIQKYKELEEVVREVYNLPRETSISYYLNHQEEFKRYRPEISYCQDVRNLLQHKKMISDTYPIEPTDEMIDFITTLTEKIRHTKKCSDICVRFDRLYYRSLDDSVKEAMRVMKSKKYNCVPVLDRKKLLGVFDENSLFEYLAQEGIVEIADNLTFRDINDHLAITNREMEEFLFYPMHKNVEELEKEFEKSFHRGKRLAVVFLTRNGKESEDILGIITAWDILSKG